MHPDSMRDETLTGRGWKPGDYFSHFLRTEGLSCFLDILLGEGGLVGSVSLALCRATTSSVTVAMLVSLPLRFLLLSPTPASLRMKCEHINVYDFSSAFWAAQAETVHKAIPLLRAVSFA